MEKELEQNLEEKITAEEVTEAETFEEENFAEEQLEAEVEELTAEDELMPEKKSGKAWIFALLAVVAALAIIFFVAIPKLNGEGENGGNTPAVNGDEIVLKIGNMEFDLNEYNFMYVSSFNDIYSNLYSYYGDSVSYIVDMTKPLEEQKVDENITWHDYVTDYTVDTLKNLTGLYEAAMAEVFTLPEEFQTDLDGIEAQLTETAKASNLTLEEYVALMYGEGVTFKNLIEMTEFRYIAGAYAEEHEAGVEVTADDVTAYYNANKDTIDTVDFRYYSFFYSEEEGALSKEEAKERAETLAAVKTSEEFNALAYEYSTEEQKAYFTEGSDPTLFAGANYDATGIEEVSAWLFEEERKQGDTMVYADENYTSYLTVFFENRNDPNYNLVDVRHILITPEEAEDGTVTEEAWTEAEALATKVLEEYLDGEMTEDSFSALAAKYSKDGNAAKGGIYEDVYKGQMVAPFENWCFAEGRKTGDTGIVETQFGYHVMYFVAEAENYLDSIVKPTVVQEQMNAWVKELAINLSAEKLEGFESAGGIIDDIVNAAAALGEAQREESSAESESTEG